MKFITINRDYDILLKDTISNYLSPNYVYLNVDNSTKLLIDPKDVIYKNDEIFDGVYSPVSGKIVGTKVLDNKKYIVIENDYKERSKIKQSVRKSISSLDKDSFLNIIKKVDINLYNKLNVDTNKIIVDSIENEPYVGNNIFINRFYTKDVLETIDSLIDIYSCNKISIIVKENDLESIEELSKSIGMFPNIDLKYLPNKYLINNDEVLCDYLNIRDSFIHLSIEDIYNIFNIVKRKKSKDEKIITITGNAIKNPQVVNVKTGTLLKSVLDELIEYKDCSYDYIINGLISGVKKDIDEVIINDEVRSVFVMKNNYVVSESCISCGKCNEVCPKNINVYNLVNNKPCDKSNCTNCGLCNYICPSFIDIKKIINGDKNE